MRPKTLTVQTGFWWATVNHPGDLPVLWATRADARKGKEPDEKIVRVMVGAVTVQRKAPKR